MTPLFFFHVWLRPAASLPLSLSPELYSFVHSFIHSSKLCTCPALVEAGDMAVTETALALPSWGSESSGRDRHVPRPSLQIREGFLEEETSGLGRGGAKTWDPEKRGMVRGDMYIPFCNKDFLCSGDTRVTVTALVPVLCFPLHTSVARRTYIAYSYVILCSLLLAYIMFKNVLHLVAKLKNRVLHIKVDISIFSGTDGSGDFRPTQPHGVTVG